MLTDAKIKTPKPAEKSYKLVDSGRLYLDATKAGGKHWHWNYDFGKNAQSKSAQKTLTFGPYSGITLVKARAMRRGEGAASRGQGSSC